MTMRGGAKKRMDDSTRRDTEKPFHLQIVLTQEEADLIQRAARIVGDAGAGSFVRVQALKHARRVLREAAIDRAALAVLKAGD